MLRFCFITTPTPTLTPVLYTVFFSLFFFSLQFTSRKEIVQASINKSSFDRLFFFFFFFLSRYAHHTIFLILFLEMNRRDWSWRIHNSNDSPATHGFTTASSVNSQVCDKIIIIIIWNSLDVTPPTHDVSPPRIFPQTFILLNVHALRHIQLGLKRFRECGASLRKIGDTTVTSCFLRCFFSFFFSLFSFDFSHVSERAEPLSPRERERSSRVIRCPSRVSARGRDRA